MQDRPTALELLGAVRRLLEDEIVPALEGRSRFLALVSANVLAIVGRELEREEDALVAEWTGLAELLGAGGSPPERLAALRAAVHEMTGTLADRIRAGAADVGPWADRARAHVRATVVEKLRVANPRYLGA